MTSRQNVLPLFVLPAQSCAFACFLLGGLFVGPQSSWVDLKPPRTLQSPLILICSAYVVGNALGFNAILYRSILIA